MPKAAGFRFPATKSTRWPVGFEIWEGPINGLESVDFYVDVE